MRGFRIRPTYANVVATLALFIALGGTALATHPGGQNTISTADIIDGQVKTADVGNGEVKVADIGQGAVAADELAANSVGAAKIADGQVNFAEIANGAVRTGEIQNGQVQAEDLAPGVAPGASGARAWGYFDAGAGTLTRQQNITAFSISATFGSYCIDPGPGIDPNTAVLIVARGEFGVDELGDDFVVPTWDPTPDACSGSEMEVENYTALGSPPSFGAVDEGGLDVQEEVEANFAFVIP